MGELSGSNDAILLHQLLLGLGALWVEGNTVHRTHLLALRLVEVADALGAQSRVVAIALGTEPSRQRSDGAPEEIDDPDGDQDRPPAGQVPGSGVALRSFADGLGGQGG